MSTGFEVTPCILWLEGADCVALYVLTFLFLDGDSEEEYLLTPTSSKVRAPIVVRVVRTEDQLAKALEFRKQRYEAVGLNMLVQTRDPMDYDEHSTVLLAENRESGDPMATIRIESGLSDTFYPTDNFEIPKRIARESSAYLTRLAGATNSDGQLAARLVLKAAYRYCIAVEIQWLLAFALRPMHRRYYSLGFDPMPESPDPIPWPADPEQTGRLVVCDLFDVERKWRETDHYNYPFFFGQRSPEIEIFSSLRPAWHAPRLPSS